MPSFTETLTVAHNLAQTISTAPSSVYDKARKYTQRSVSWKKTFDEAGVALLGGYDAMMEPKRTSSKSGRRTISEGSQISDPSYSPRVIYNGPTSMVHGIRCVALPTRPEDQPRLVDRSFWDQAKFPRRGKHIRISRPILIGEDDNDIAMPAPPPVEKDEKFRRGTAHRVRLDVITSPTGFTVRDISSSLKVSTTARKGSPSGFTRLHDGPESPVSPRGKMMYPGFTGIPGDLPCHERYVPLSRSRSTHILEAQRGASPVTGDEADGEDDVDADEGWSDASSVYSQDSIADVEPLRAEPLPR